MNDALHLVMFGLCFGVVIATVGYVAVFVLEAINKRLDK